MPAQYLLRFDDLCPTMNWPVWEEIEGTLVEHGVRPILAVVPDNRDDKLAVGPPRADFWDAVRSWQQRGWAIALHGYQHKFVTQSRGIVGLHRRSEFAGLPLEPQKQKLWAAAKILRQQGIEPRVWVAPAHSFDWATVDVLRELEIRVISDGFAIAPHRDTKGMFWIPQQLWRFRWRPFGVWTVCYHHNRWASPELERFKEDMARWRKQISSVAEIEAIYQERERDWLDVFYGRTHRTVLALRG